MASDPQKNFYLKYVALTEECSFLHHPVWDWALIEVQVLVILAYTCTDQWSLAGTRVLHINSLLIKDT